MVVLGARMFDVQSKAIYMESEELAVLIMQPNGIQILF